MRASTLLVGLTAISGVALAWAPYVNTVVDTSTITVINCGPEVSSCAGRTTSTPVPESTVCTTEVETIETTEYKTSFPPTVAPPTPSYGASTEATPVVPTTLATATSKAQPPTSPVQSHASGGVTSGVASHSQAPTSVGSTSHAQNSTTVASESASSSKTHMATMTSIPVVPSTKASESPTAKPTTAGAGTVAASSLMMGLLAFGAVLFV